MCSRCPHSNTFSNNASILFVDIFMTDVKKAIAAVKRTAHEGNQGSTPSSVNAYPKPADSKYCTFFLYCRTTHYISLQMLTFSAPNFCSFSQRLDTGILKVSINFLTFASVPRRTKVTSGHQRKDNYCEVQICCFATLPASNVAIFS